MNRREMNRERALELLPLFFSWTVIRIQVGGKYPKSGKYYWKRESRTTSGPTQNGNGFSQAKMEKIK